MNIAILLFGFILISTSVAAVSYSPPKALKMMYMAASAYDPL